MKLRLTAEVNGLLFLSEAPEPLELADGVVFGFKCDSSRRMTHVTVSVPMNADQVARMRNLMTPAPGRAPNLEISGIDDVVAILEQRLRWLEGRLSFGPQGDALHSINLWECEFEFLPETPDEQALTAVTSFQVTEHERLPEPTRLTAHELKEIVKQLDGYDDELAILQGFFRQARNHWLRSEYVEAFHDYYFVIEGLYSAGKSGEKEVIRAFMANDRLPKLAEISLNAFRRQPKVWSWLKEQLRRERLVEDGEGVLRLLFRIRGDLRHFSPRSSRKVITPFNHRDFRTATLLVMNLTTLALSDRMTVLKGR